jgi:general L-amino acid transport system substrate-binding protein
MRKTIASSCIAIMSLLVAGECFAADGDTLNAIRARGALLCGVSTGGSVGMSTLDDRGQWRGLEVDFCRAVSAAVLADASKVQFVPLEFRNAFAALQSGAVDILARSATWTFTREVEMRFEFAGIYMYDGQGFMVSRRLGVTSARQLEGASICVTGGSTTELNLADYFRANHMTYRPIVTNSREQNQANLDAGRCDAYTNERGGLAASRTALRNPDDYVILPETISKEPLGPILRRDDQRFRDVVTWTLRALIAGEELGLTAANVREMAASSANPEVQRLLGRSGDFANDLGVAADWAVQAIAAVGNYGEMFERNLGSGSRVNLDRGQNNLWSNGGLMYVPPFR